MNRRNFLSFLAALPFVRRFTGAVQTTLIVENGMTVDMRTLHPTITAVILKEGGTLRFLDTPITVMTTQKTAAEPPAIV